MSITRRTFAASLAAATTTATAAAAPRPEGVLVDTHIHLFAMDRERFPFAPMGTYAPEPQGLSDYTAFVHQSGIDHAIVVHPEPYQDDHSYLEYCLDNEPKPGFFKGTCLYDSARSDTPARLKRLMGRYPDRIVAFRIHAMGERGSVPSETGPIKNRDLTADYMRRTWRAVADAGIAIQMHFLPFYAPLINSLCSQFPDVPVILDHLGRSGLGTSDDYAEVLALSKYPNVYMKYSGVGYSSKTGYPFEDALPIVREAFYNFGPDRMIWGGLGMNMQDFERNVAVLDDLFEYASEEDRAKIRGLTAVKLFDL